MEEVGAAEPAGGAEGGLEDDGRTALHCGECLVELRLARSVSRNLYQSWRYGAQILQVSALSSVTLLLEQLQGWILCGFDEWIVQVP